MNAAAWAADSCARKTELSLIFSGCAMASWRSNACCLTGECATAMPRPWGRSGRVTTRETLWPYSSSLSRVGTAKWGVPQKTTFMGATCLPLARALQLLDFALNHIPLQGADVGDE